MKKWISFLTCFFYLVAFGLQAEVGLDVGYTLETKESGMVLSGLCDTCEMTPQPAAAVQAAQYPLNTSVHLDSDWGSGYQVTVTLTNTASTPTSSWSASFTLPTGAKIGSLWNGVYSVSGQQVTVKNPSWGAAIPANGSTTFGLVVNGNPAVLNNLQAVANGTVPPPPPMTPPSAPVLNPVSQNPSTPGTYTVSWNSVSNATSYTLQQATTSGFTSPTTVFSGSGVSFAFTNQQNGTYYYRVRASNAAGSSSFSNVVSVSVNIPPVVLSAPVLQPISNPSSTGQYTVNWSAVTDAQGYTLQESTTSSFANLTTLFSGTATSFQVTGKAAGTYYYRVLAFSGSSQSPFSNIVNTVVTTPPPPPPPTGHAILETYWESWDSALSVSTIAGLKFDTINISFGTFSSLGNHTFQVSGVDASTASVAQLVSAAHSMGKKVKISIGGATYPLSGMLTTTQDAVGMAQAVATYVQQNNLDGVDYDIEDYPAASLQIALIQNTRQVLGANALISYTPMSPASSTLPYVDVIKGAHSYLTGINIMAYNYGPGYTYQADVQALVGFGVPASKILVGLMPGRDDVGFLTTVANITTASNYVVQNGLGGLMFWDLNRDHKNQTGLGVDATTNTAWPILHP